MNPTSDQALQFAIMLKAGLPASEAILYFVPNEDPALVAAQLAGWMRSREVKRAISQLNGKAWQEMSLEERIHAALDQHYAGLAYFLFSRNYTELSQTDKAKADTARQALEAKVAGTAGKLDALSQFAADISAGRVKLLSPAPDRTKLVN